MGACDHTGETATGSGTGVRVGGGLTRAAWKERGGKAWTRDRLQCVEEPVEVCLGVYRWKPTPAAPARTDARILALCRTSAAAAAGMDTITDSDGANFSSARSRFASPSVCASTAARSSDVSHVSERPAPNTLNHAGDESNCRAQPASRSGNPYSDDHKSSLP
jgi:hypothetical protein